MTLREPAWAELMATKRPSPLQLMVVLDASVVNIAMPRIQADLGFSDANLTWVITSYTIAFGGLLLLGGRMGDVLGRRKVFMFGVGLFAIASLMVSKNSPQSARLGLARRGFKFGQPVLF